MDAATLGNVAQTLADKCFAEVQVKSTEYFDDEEGEELCNCEFSLAYGAKILLNNAALRLKRGRRYGLCGPNGVGKVGYAACHMGLQPLSCMWSALHMLIMWKQGLPSLVCGLPVVLLLEQQAVRPTTYPVRVRTPLAMD